MSVITAPMITVGLMRVPALFVKVGNDRWRYSLIMRCVCR